MAKAKSIVRQKKPGRPAIGGGETGESPVIQVRFPPGLVEQVEAWAKYEKTSRSDAVRRLVELGLKVKR